MRSTTPLKAVQEDPTSLSEALGALHDWAAVSHHPSVTRNGPRDEALDLERRDLLAGILMSVIGGTRSQQGGMSNEDSVVEDRLVRDFIGKWVGARVRLEAQSQAWLEQLASDLRQL